jgi:hypothetical protein
MSIIPFKTNFYIFIVFDLSLLEWSKLDRKRNITIPSVPNQILAEEVGIHIGDGSMNIYGGTHLYSLRGHRVDDEEYYRNYIPKIYKRLYNLDVNIRTWPDVIGFQCASKVIIKFKHDLNKLPLGIKGDITIPEFVMRNPSFMRACLRGIFDTDGCVYLEKKSQGLYPRIQIASVSEPLISQVASIFDLMGFNFSRWIAREKSIKWKRLYNITLRGFENTKKWFEIVGSNNPKHVKRFDMILK